nr:phage/plasmid primase, P4 family [Aeoliella straminimaris]
MVNRFGMHFRYVGTWNKWLVWEGGRWRRDDTAAVHRLAQSTVRAIFDEARDEPDDARRNSLAKWALSSQSNGRLESMIKIAATQPEIAIHHDELNRHPHLLNCQNGVVDLRTGDLLPHDPHHLLTQTTGLDYPTESVSPELWLETLGTIFAGDTSMVQFVQRLFGLGVLGEVVEHLLAIFHGAGANGKSLVVETAMGAMGDYAVKAPRDFCIASKHEQHPTAIADLYSRRLVVITETGDGQRLDEALIKELTGGDTLRARRMREDYWQFTPSHLALMVTNHQPMVKGTDNGIWRRLKMVPFDVVIPPEKQDPELPRKLKAEWPKILRWMVDGYLDYQRRGLDPPAAVQEATNAYRSEMDSFGVFINECCTLGQGLLAKGLYKSYSNWCDQRGEKPVAGKTFAKRMDTTPGISSYRSNGTVYEGIGLND